MKKYIVMLITNDQHVLNRILKVIDWKDTEYTFFTVMSNPMHIVNYISKICPHIVILQPLNSILTIENFAQICRTYYKSMQFVVIDDSYIFPDCNDDEIIVVIRADGKRTADRRQ